LPKVPLSEVSREALEKGLSRGKPVQHAIDFSPNKVVLPPISSASPEAGEAVVMPGTAAIVPIAGTNMNGVALRTRITALIKARQYINARAADLVKEGWLTKKPWGANSQWGNMSTLVMDRMGTPLDDRANLANVSLIEAAFEKFLGYDDHAPDEEKYGDDDPYDDDAFESSTSNGFDLSSSSVMKNLDLHLSDRTPDPMHARTAGPGTEGAATFAGNGLSDDHDKAKDEAAKSMDKEIMANAMNKEGDGGGDSNLKAAGDTGLGNAMKYDFIRAEGRGSTGQDILAGDQTTNKQAGNRQTAAEVSGTDPLAKNGVGQNQILTHKMLTDRLDQRGSDKILDPVTYDHGRASLRPQFLLGGEDAVRRTAREKMEMDAQFDMFDFVPEGFGLGAHNKMFIQEQNRDRLIRYAEPLPTPRPKDGSELTNDQFDARLMPVIHNIPEYIASMMNEMSSKNERVKRQKVASVNTLADDNNTHMSSKGLRGRKPSPFEPVIQTRSQWIPTHEPAGVDMKRQLKGFFNTQRTPQRHIEYNPHNGMPTLGKRRAMEIILP